MKLCVVIDFETASACDLTKAGSARYAEDPTTEILCCAYEVLGEPVGLWLPTHGAQGPLYDLAHNPEIWFVAHNAGFEKDIWRAVMVPYFGFPDIPDNRWHDTMASAAYKALPQKLDWCARVLKLPQQKDTEGSRLTKAMSKPVKGYLDRADEKLQRVYEYCRQDIAVETALHARVGWLPPQERQVWLLDQRINQRGIGIDLEYVRACQKIVDDASKPLKAEFHRLTGGLNLGQVAKIQNWLISAGVSLPNLRKETLAEVLGETDADDELSSNELPQAQVSLPDDVRRALHIRQLIGSASIKKLAAMEACVCADGRARRLLQYHGTGPGRWAGRLLQPQNFPRPTLEIEGHKVSIDLLVDTLKIGDHQIVEMTLGPAVEAVVSGLRHALIAAPGRVFLSGDYAGIQARTVLALAGQHDKTALIAAGADIYCDMASQIYGHPVNKKDHPEERQTGKNSVLGLGFQMGAPKFKLKYGKDQTLDFIKNVVAVYRDEWAPCVPRLWRALDAAVTECVHSGRPTEAYGCIYGLRDGWLVCRLPSGRKIWYYGPQPCFRPMPWDETDIRPGVSFKAWKLGQWVTRYGFGGLYTENVVMGIERDIMVDGMFRLEKNGFPIVLTVHDELVAEPLKADADEKAFVQILCEQEPWLKDLRVPINVEWWKGDRYRK